MSEQWESGGDCNACRRKNYCKTKCREYGRRVQREFSGLVQQVACEAIIKMERSMRESRKR